MFAALMLCIMLPGQALALHPAAGSESECWSQLNRQAPLQSITPEQVENRGADGWHCDDHRPPVGEVRIALTFDVDEAHPSPRYLTMRVGTFDGLAIFAQTPDGQWTKRLYTTGDSVALSDGPYFRVTLPRAGEQIERVIAVFDAPFHKPTLATAFLSEISPDRTAGSISHQLILAVLLGMILIPLVFDVAFWKVLRQRFLIWHAALILSFASLLLLRSGLINHYIPLPLELWRYLLVMSLGTSLAITFMFARSYIEPGRLSDFFHRAAPYAAIWAVLGSAIHAMQFDILLPLGGSFHTYAIGPLLFLFVAMVFDAWRRGSRAVKYLVIGWIPLIVGSAIQMATSLLPIGVPMEAFEIFFFGMFTESVATALGVADRFLAIRNARDAAERKIATLDELSNRDPLTGLFNRRAIENQFADLHRSGYETFAVIDLDHFKGVNDTHGHAIGDEVLQVTAATLKSDPMGLAVRLGGEEFLLALQGSDGAERAERIRKAISLRVTRQVDVLDQILTASMGLVVVPHSAMPNAKFADIYSRADKLLYEAKENGRNRTVSEKMRSFKRRQGDRRRATAA